MTKQELMAKADADIAATIADCHKANAARDKAVANLDRAYAACDRADTALLKAYAAWHRANAMPDDVAPIHMEGYRLCPTHGWVVVVHHSECPKCGHVTTAQ